MLYIYFFLILTACSNNFDYRATANEIIGKQIKITKREEGLQAFGVGGAMADGISSIKVDFVSYRDVDIPEARRMIVRAIERMKNAINAEESLKEYLTLYPFPVSGVNIGILFFDESGGFIKRGCVWLGTGGVSSVFQLNNTLFYSSHNPRTTLLESYYEESYEEALAIVNYELNECVTK